MSSNESHNDECANIFHGMTDKVQQQLFDEAFTLVKNKHQTVTLQTCLLTLFDETLESKNVLSVGWACLSLAMMQSDEFENIEPGITQKIQKSIIAEMSNKL
jgi:hypothetical protein